MTIGKKNGMANANKDKAKGDEKFKLEDKKFEDAIIMNITGTETLKLCQDIA
ncbi:MAG: hypothetical protein ABJN69_09890 [Hellea sp.]